MTLCPVWVEGDFHFLISGNSFPLLSLVSHSPAPILKKFVYFISNSSCTRVDHRYHMSSANLHSYSAKCVSTACISGALTRQEPLPFWIVSAVSALSSSLGRLYRLSLLGQSEALFLDLLRSCSHSGLQSCQPGQGTRSRLPAVACCLAFGTGCTSLMAAGVLGDGIT